jgi:Protein of unknown function (DUF2934)
MAETPKKKTTTKTATANKPATAAKPRKAPAKKAASAAKADPVAANGNVATMERPVAHDEVARLAHTYWQQRGHRHGQHEDDWYRAEQELRGKAS